MNAEIGPILRSLSRRKSVFALVVAELASGFTVISCLLMASAWYVDIGHTPSGLPERELIRIAVERPAPGSDPDRAMALAARLREDDLRRIQATEGVKAAAAVSTSAAEATWSFATRMTLDEPQPPPGATGWTVRATADVAEVLGLRTLEGRLPVGLQTGEVVITRSLRERLFPGGARAVGRRFASEDAPAATVAAVVEDFRARMPFLPFSEHAALYLVPPANEREAQYLVRVEASRRDAVRATLTGMFPASSGSMRVVVENFDPTAFIREGFVYGVLVMLGIMGVTVGLLALLGALAVSSFLVAERTRQIGIRRALGATRLDVIRYFLVENAMATLLGTLVGLALTLALFLVMRRIFVGIRLNPLLLGLTGGLLWIDATLAAMIPARRAAEIPPSVASRATSSA